MGKKLRILVCGAVVLLGILADQLTKWLAVRYLRDVETVPLWRGVLHLTYVENRGAAFGILSEHRWVFLVVSSVALVAILVYLFLSKKQSTLSTVALSMIISGGIGNMIDRILLGYVVDFIDFTLINFAVFNAADSFVCIGAALLLIAILREPGEGKRQKKDTP